MPRQSTRTARKLGGIPRSRWLLNVPASDEGLVFEEAGGFDVSVRAKETAAHSHWTT